MSALDVLAVMARDAEDAGVLRMRRGDLDCIANTARSIDARRAVAQLVEKAGNLCDYLDAYVYDQRAQGDDIGADIAENDIADFRAALARFGGAA